MIILDVREKDEFRREQIPGSILCSMSELSLVAPGILKNLPDEEITLMCRSGHRAKMAMYELKRLGIDKKFKVFEGGITEWKAQGKPISSVKRKVIPMMRQVQISAGLLILLGVVGHFTLDLRFIYLSAFVGAGLIFSGLTGFCAMMLILEKMPWNKRKDCEENSCSC